MTQADKRLTPEFKSYQDFFKAKLQQQETIVKDLKSHQKHIKDNSENFVEQMNMFKNLKQLLTIKVKAVKDDADEKLNEALPALDAAIEKVKKI